MRLHLINVLKPSDISNFSRYLSSNISEHQKKLMQRGLPKQKELPGVKNIICVASGKGGVGKLTEAVNIAFTLANRFNLKTGLLDADIYGPSIPKMMNLESHQPEVDSFDKFLLIDALKKFIIKTFVKINKSKGTLEKNTQNVMNCAFPMSSWMCFILLYQF